MPPYDDPTIIAGQGTVGREIAEDIAALGATPDLVIAPASGGGLVAGVATAIKAKFPDAQVLTAEPEGFDDHANPAAGRRDRIKPVGRTICDALMAPMPGEITFAVNNTLGAWRHRLRCRSRRSGQIRLQRIEACGRARRRHCAGCAVGGRVEARGKTIVIVLSGGNVDADLFANLVA